LATEGVGISVETLATIGSGEGAVEGVGVTVAIGVVVPQEDKIKTTITVKLNFQIFLIFIPLSDQWLFKVIFMLSRSYCI